MKKGSSESLVNEGKGENNDQNSIEYRYFTTVTKTKETSEWDWQQKRDLIHTIWNHRVARALTWVVIILLLGAFGFYIIIQIFHPEPFAYAFLDSLYLSVITLTTVGYGDHLELLSLPQPGRTIGETFSIIYMLVAYGVVVWASSTIVAYLVEGSLSGVLLRRRILRKVKMLKDHYILCGIGMTGADIAEEFHKTGNSVVIIELDKESISNMKSSIPEDELLAVEGDATEEDVLQKAGILRARGIICNLSNDRDNLFLTLTARALNPKLRIVSKGVEHKSKEKILRAGADSVIYPGTIGALRMASEMIRPTVVSFLDKMLRDTRDERVSEVTLTERSKYTGKSIRDSGIYEDTGMLVLAILSPNNVSKEFIYNPPADEILEPGAVLVVIGGTNQINTLEKYADPDSV
ncbi:potassium channel protein [Desulfobacterota bacterium AH_259_B03_O07]|nr:potassium channel protein [Desulfobacterota bacterium AH_259_B03_O07]